MTRETMTGEVKGKKSKKEGKMGGNCLKKKKDKKNGATLTLYAGGA
jgi:hypothetical protein